MARLRAPLLIIAWALLIVGCCGVETTTETSINPSLASTFFDAASGSAMLSAISGSGTGSSTKHKTTASATLLQGTVDKDSTTSASGNGTHTSNPSKTVTVTTAPDVTNTQPCNLYVEFCTRSYGNITNVAAHNSPFVRKNNAAANQHLTVEQQLNDGIRMLQGQTHKENGTLYYCHTTCDLLNAGTVEAYLTRVVKWMLQNPFEVVTILIGNGDFVPIDEWKEPLENSGIADLAYVPQNRSVHYNQWPTLSELILSGKRAVVFMDYKADQGILPYVMDEFTYMWESPFSQTDQAFPCTIERPEDQNKTDTEGKMYMANHNLNVEFSFGGTSLLVPNTVYVNQTNGVSGYGSLGLMSNNCAVAWSRYPNFLLVDFYEEGDPKPGSVFEVAALANNVTYTRSCCGKAPSGASHVRVPRMTQMLGAMEAMMVFLFVLCR